MGSLNDSRETSGHLAHVMLIVKHEGGDVGRDDGRVENEDQHQPVPDGLERRVVQNYEARNGRRWRTTADCQSVRLVDVVALRRHLPVAAVAAACGM